MCWMQRAAARRVWRCRYQAGRYQAKVVIPTGRAEEPALALAGAEKTRVSPLRIPAQPERSGRNDKFLFSKGKPSRRKGFCLLARLGLVDLDEDDNEGEQRQRLNKREAEHQQGEDAGARSGIASDSFRGGGGGAALAQSATCGGKAHAETGGDGDESVTGGRFATGSLCPRR